MSYLSIRKKSNITLILTVILVCVITALPFIFSTVNALLSHSPVAQNGISDFSDIVFTKSRPIYLRGNWKKYENKWIITNADGSRADEKHRTLPVKFMNALDAIDSPIGDKSSYSLTLKNIEAKNVIFYIPHFAGSYKIFLDGELVTDSGEYAGGTTKADLSVNSTPVNLTKTKNYSLVIEASCNYMDGLYMTPAIADFEHAASHAGFSVTLRSLIFGAVAFCTLLFCVYSVSKHRIFHSKWLPVLFFVILLRMAISTDGYTSFSFILSRLDYEPLTLLICSSTFIIKLISLLFYTETLDIKLSKLPTTVFGTLFLLLTFIYCAFPKMVYTPFYNVILQLATLPLDIILLGYLTDSIARKVPYSVFYTLGYIAILSGLLIDCFYTNGLIAYDAASYLPLLFALFVLTFSVIFIKRITEIYNSALKAAELDRQLTNANTAIMVSQIQPHFLYNALNTIKYLIKHDPKKAENALISFSYYLRGNMESLTQKSPIPLSDEIEHVKHYSDIELLRFGNKIRVEYDIQCSDFAVPALTIQPIVENAIKHGITKKPDGGTVKISAFETDSQYCITIDDDGVGFCVESPDYSDDEYHAHIGISNVAKRLKHMVNATFDIQSCEDEGTHVTIKIPKTEGKI